MTKNLFYNDLIGVAVVSVLFAIFYFSGGQGDGLPLYSKLAIIPVFAVSLTSFSQLQYVAYGAPFLSVKTVIKGVSFGIVMACIHLSAIADLSDRLAVVIIFLTQFTITSFFWALLSPRSLTDKQVKKQTRFQTVQELEAYNASLTIDRWDIVTAIMIAVIAITSIVWGNSVFGIVFLLNSNFIMAHKIQICTEPLWYSALRQTVFFLSFGLTVGLGVS